MKHKQRGAALIELALVLPLLLLMSITVVEFGRAVYQYGLIVKSVRDAARFLSVQTPGTHLAEACNLVVYGNIEGTGAALAPGLTVAHCLDAAQNRQPYWATAGMNPMINTVTITVQGYTFNSMFASVFGLPFGSYQFSDIRASMRAAL